MKSRALFLLALALIMSGCSSSSVKKVKMEETGVSEWQYNYDTAKEPGIYYFNSWNTRGRYSMYPDDNSVRLPWLALELDCNDEPVVRFHPQATSTQIWPSIMMSYKPHKNVNPVSVYRGKRELPLDTILKFWEMSGYAEWYVSVQPKHADPDPDGTHVSGTEESFHDVYVEAPFAKNPIPFKPHPKVSKKMKSLCKGDGA